MIIWLENALLQMLNIKETIQDLASNARKWATNLGSVQPKVVMVAKVIQVSEEEVINQEDHESASSVVMEVTCQENVQHLMMNI